MLRNMWNGGDEAVMKKAAMNTVLVNTSLYAVGLFVLWDRCLGIRLLSQSIVAGIVSKESPD